LEDQRRFCVNVEPAAGSASSCDPSFPEVPNGGTRSASTVVNVDSDGRGVVADVRLSSAPAVAFSAPENFGGLSA
jgi:hypothetical protein